MSELRTNKIYPRDGLPAGASGGGIIQVVQNIQGLGQINSSTYGTAEYDLGLSCTITPQRSDSKILINANWPAIYLGAFGTQYFLNRGTTHIHEYQVYHATTTWTNAYPNMMFLDSPATTSPVTYKITVQVTSSADLRTNYNASTGDDGTVHGDLIGYGSRSTMLLMEISG